MKYLILLLIVVMLIIGYFIPKKPYEPVRGLDKNIIITLDRTPCFGYCPDYSLIIRGDGSVVYEGRSFVAEVGKREGTISTEDFKKLVDEFYAIKYFTLKNMYDAGVSDVPTTTTSITIDGKTKKVMNRYNGPGELGKLENNIDKAVNSERWTKKLIELGPMRKLSN